MNNIFLNEHLELGRGQFLKTPNGIYYPELAIPIPYYKKQGNFEYINVLYVLCIQVPDKDSNFQYQMFSYDICDRLNKETLSEINNINNNRAVIAFIFLKNQKVIIEGIEDLKTNEIKNKYDNSRKI